MNRWQIGKQVKALLAAATWADSGLVFPSGSVLVTARARENAMKDLRLPIAIVLPGAGQADEERQEQPGLLSFDLLVSIVVKNEADQVGETTLLGHGRQGGSRGRGLLEVEERVMTTLLQLGPASGLPIELRHQSDPELGETSDFGYIATAQYQFRARGTTFRTYQRPTRLVATGGVGTVSLSWVNPPRFDFRRAILRRAAGATPPASSVAGTGVTLGASPDGAGVTTKVDAPGAGTWSYALFAAYDDTGAGSDVAISDAEVVSATAT